MSEPFLGQIQCFGFNFAPRGWATCDGQILSIAQNTALFSLLGTMYGGNGQTTFALPDLRGRVSMHFGTGPGLSPYTQGEVSGSEAVTLLQTQIPSHNHLVNASTAEPTDSVPNGLLLGSSAIYTGGNPTSVMNPQSIGFTGGSQPHSNLQPFLVLNWCIALEGIFPSRN